MAQVVVVYHSGYGHTQRMAQAVARGADAQLLAIDAEGGLNAEGWAALDAADAIIFGSPTYMGGVSWQFKRFADATSKVWARQGWKDKLFAGFSNSSCLDGDRLATLHYLITLAMQHGGLWVGTGMHASNRPGAQRDDLNYLGSFAGAGAQSPAGSSAADMSRGDLETAALFGERVAAVAAKLRG